MRASIRYALALLLLLITLNTPSARAQTAPQAIPILAYHRFDPHTPASTTVTTATFLGQMDYLQSHGYTVAPLRQVLDVLYSHKPMPHPLAAVTVDDGHESVYTVLFPILKQRHLPVTLFIYPSAISNAHYALTWDQLKEMRASGLVDIQSHTYWHPDFRKDKAHRTPDDYARFVDMQLTRSRTKLDQELGTHIDLLAWPYGILDPELEAAARRNGYLAAFGYDGFLAHPGDDAFAIHRIPVPDFARGNAFAALLQGAKVGHPVRE